MISNVDRTTKLTVELLWGRERREKGKIYFEILHIIKF